MNVQLDVTMMNWLIMSELLNISRSVKMPTIKQTTSKKTIEYDIFSYSEDKTNISVNFYMILIPLH